MDQEENQPFQGHYKTVPNAPETFIPKDVPLPPRHARFRRCIGDHYETSVAILMGVLIVSAILCLILGGGRMRILPVISLNAAYICGGIGIGAAVLIVVISIIRCLCNPNSGI